MKHILTIALLLSAIVSWGQKNDSSKLSILSLPRAYYGFPGERLPPVDTIKVLYLLSDTGPHDSWYRGTFDALQKLGYPFTKIGYIAERKKADQWNASFWMVAEAYLDENKKPLPSTSIIWQTKTIP